MSNEAVKEAEGLIRSVGRQINDKSMLDIKYKTLQDIKIKLYNALVLLDSKPEKRDITNIDRSVALLTYFNENYPGWDDASREAECIVPRQILQYCMFFNSKLKLKQIAALTGGYDHTTVIHSRQKVQDMLDTGNAEYCEIYNKVIEFLNGLKESK